ncbi:MAG: hypothetical protein ACFB3T_13425 [Geminicoccaceae bacterium]
MINVDAITAHVLTAQKTASSVYAQNLANATVEGYRFQLPVAQPTKDPAAPAATAETPPSVADFQLQTLTPETAEAGQAWEDFGELESIQGLKMAAAHYRRAISMFKSASETITQSIRLGIQ